MQHLAETMWPRDGGLGWSIRYAVVTNFLGRRREGLSSSTWMFPTHISPHLPWWGLNSLNRCNTWRTEGLCLFRATSIFVAVDIAFYRVREQSIKSLSRIRWLSRCSTSWVLNHVTGNTHVRQKKGMEGKVSEPLSLHSVLSHTMNTFLKGQDTTKYHCSDKCLCNNYNYWLQILHNATFHLCGNDNSFSGRF